MTNFSYVTLLYPDKYNNVSYLDGVILTGLGLRRQNVKYKLICLITPDVSNDVINIIKIIYDETIVVPYISPLKNAEIKIMADIFSPNDYVDENNYSEMCKIFTKLNIFNSVILPYDKICFIDSDLIPIRKFDELFNLNTPAGWLEKINDNGFNSYARHWDTWESINNNDLIPKILTDIFEPPGTSINAGLLVIRPDYELFKLFINQLQTPKDLWVGLQYLHKGNIDWQRKFNQYYICPEQDYLTQHFSGQWHMINGLYCAWGNCSIKKVYGIHMAGNRFMINDNWHYKKTWQLQLTDNFKQNMLTNLLMIWGILNYPKLKKNTMKNLKIYVNNNFVDFDKIIINDVNFNSLTFDQQLLHKYLHPNSPKFNVSMFI
jgi:alpha-N-acetylglucosamine transferase